MTAKRILCPIDFSHHGDAAVNYASCLAHAMEAKIYFLHVEELATPYDASYTGCLPCQAELDRNERELLKVVPTLPGVAYEHDSCLGNPAETILDFAKKHDIDLIVMGTHGRTGVSRFVLGSVAEMVVRRADCPVLTVKQPVRAPACR